MEVVIFKQEFPGDNAVLIFAHGFLLEAGNWEHNNLGMFVLGFFTATVGLYDPNCKVIEVLVETPEGYCITDYSEPGLSMTDWANIIKEEGFTAQQGVDVTKEWL